MVVGAASHEKLILIAYCTTGRLELRHQRTFIYHFVPIAIETSIVFVPKALSFLRELGRRIKADTGEPRSLQFLLQGITVAVQQALHPPQTLFTFNYGTDTAVP